MNEENGQRTTLEDKEIYKTQISFPFKPEEYPAPPFFPGCYCVAPCKCKYEDENYVSPEGDFIPFKPDVPVQPPRVCVWEHLTREDYKRLALANYTQETVFSLFDEKFTIPPDGNAREVLLQLLYEALRYSRVNMMSTKKSSALVSMYYNTHQYFISSLWRSPEDTYKYFKECILLHTVQRPPKSMEVFDPDESHQALVHFINVYVRHLALVAASCLPNYRLQLIWPSQSLTPQVSQKEREDSINNILNWRPSLRRTGTLRKKTSSKYKSQDKE